MFFINYSQLSVCIRDPIVFLLGIFTVLCIMARFAAPWLVSVLKYGTAAFIPIRYTWGQISDDYFYYARIRDILDGNLLCTDPLIYEYRRRPHAHATYQASLCCCALLGLFTRNTTHAYMGATAIYPTLQFVLLAVLAMTCTGSPGFGLLAASGVYFTRATNNLDRTPNILFTGFHLALICLLGWERLYGSPSPAEDILLLVAIALSPIISVSNMIFSIFFIFGLMLRAMTVTWSASGFYLACMAAALPFGFWALQNICGVKSLLIFGNTTNCGCLRQEVRKTVVRYLAAPIFIYGVQAVYFGNYVYFYGLVLCTATLCFLVILLQSRKLFMANLTVVRGTITLTLLVAAINAWHIAAGTLTLVFEWIGIAGLIRPGTATASYACAGVALCLAAQKAGQVLNNQTARANLLHDGDFYTLVQWARTISPKEVILTLDFDVNTNLPIYSPACFYIPQAIQSTATEAEIWQRLFEACRFLRVSYQTFLAFWARSVPHFTIENDSKLVQPGLASLNMTYLKYAANWANGYNMPEEDILARALQYKRLLGEPAKLSFRATIILVSTAQALHVNLFAKLRGFPGLCPIFTNSRYAAYRIDANTQNALAALRQRLKNQLSNV